MEEIPLIAVDRQRVVVRLGSTDVALTIFYQPRQGQWYCSVELPPGTPYAVGRQMDVDVDVLGGLEHPLGGRLVVRDTSNAARELGENPWSGTHRLVYEAHA